MCLFQKTFDALLQKCVCLFQKTFDALLQITMLKSNWISKASALQRRGRSVYTVKCSMLGEKNSADDSLKYMIFEKIGYEISCKLSS